MAQWSDPRVTGTQSSLEGVGYGAGAVAVDAGLRAHMLRFTTIWRRASC